MWVPVRNDSSGRAKNRFRMGDLREMSRARSTMGKNRPIWRDGRFPTRDSRQLDERRKSRSNQRWPSRRHGWPAASPAARRAQSVSGALRVVYSIVKECLCEPRQCGQARRTTLWLALEHARQWTPNAECLRPTSESLRGTATLRVTTTSPRRSRLRSGRAPRS
jgi:hypothetical protein